VVKLVVNGLIYLTYGVVTGRIWEKLPPIRPRDIVQTVAHTLHFKIAHEDIAVYNAVQKLLYIIVILAGISQVVTGLQSPANSHRNPRPVERPR
jgi:thiosulfate reductase cytochrome b subunit